MSLELAPDGDGVCQWTHEATRAMRGHCGHRPSLFAGGGATERQTRPDMTCWPNGALQQYMEGSRLTPADPRALGGWWPGRSGAGSS